MDRDQPKTKTKLQYDALATDYDGTLAHDGVVEPSTIAALERARRDGRRLILVTGRQLDDLMRVFPEMDRFDLVVAENGALLYTPNPPPGKERVLAEPPTPEFAARLRSRGVNDVATGRVIVATWEPHEIIVLETIREMGLELEVIFNKGAVMVLPSGVNKASGLAAALEELGIQRERVIGVGDAENDHSLLAACGFGVALANAVPSLKEKADHVTVNRNGRGVVELIEELLIANPEHTAAGNAAIAAQTELEEQKQRESIADAR